MCVIYILVTHYAKQCYCCINDNACSNTPQHIYHFICRPENGHLIFIFLQKLFPNTVPTTNDKMNDIINKHMLLLFSRPSFVFTCGMCCAFQYNYIMAKIIGHGNNSGNKQLAKWARDYTIRPIKAIGTRHKASYRAQRADKGKKRS